jgi:hypothetical protein
MAVFGKNYFPLFLSDLLKLKPMLSLGKEILYYCPTCSVIRET